MSKYSPYSILNWQLDDPQELIPGNERAYICCWWKQVPLANIWWEANESWREIEEQIKKAILPTVLFYLGNKEEELIPQLQTSRYESLDILLSQHFKDHQKEGPARPVSVVICTRNRAASLADCLKHLMACTGNFEIIVVDNSPTSDDTKAVVQQFTGVKYVAEPRPGLDIARNTGASRAAFEIIAYTDDDVIVPVNWVDNISKAFQSPQTMAVTGLVIPLELETVAQYMFEKYWSFNKGYQQKIFDQSYFAAHKSWGAPVWEIGAGANMAFRKKAFERAGYFDERLDAGAAGCSGDSEMWFRILGEGYQCEYLPHIFVHHQHRKSIAALKNQLYNYMKGHVAALYIQEEKYPGTGNMRRIKKSLPLYYLKQIPRAIFTRNNNFIIEQIKGCLAGRRFYRNNPQVKKGENSLPQTASTPARDFENKLVSVVITCYNLGYYLTAAIESVLKQTHPKKDIIVVDDGSTDDTPLLCSQYGEKIKYCRVDRVGLSAARNAGIKMAGGSFVVLLDADDFLYEEALEVNGYFFDYYPEMKMVSGAHTIVNEKGETIEIPRSKTTIQNNYLSLLQGNYIAMEGTVMYRKEIFDEFQFDSSLPVCEDYDINLKIARHYPVLGHDKIIAAYRKHDNNMSGNKEKMREYALKVLQRQEPHLLNEAERAAWNQGLNNWKNYYNPHAHA
ncbi:MAG: glycosyltransferase [Chitinophagaceae bacterium]|nr:MAG: glycosyltransferase [Chitinophagaceae bacterium]